MFNFRPHDIVVDPISGASVVRERTNYVTLMSGGERFYLQDGQVFQSENRPPLRKDQIPGWVYEQIRTLSPQARAMVGFVNDEERQMKAEEAARTLLNQAANLSPEVLASLQQMLEPVKPLVGPVEPDPYQDPPLEEDELISQPPQVLDPNLWNCPECHKDIRPKAKGVHIACFKRLGRCVTNG